MTKQSTIQVRIDAEQKSQAEILFASLGTSLSEAVRLFVAQSVRERRLPFTPSLIEREGDDRAFGALAHYANPRMGQGDRAAWLKSQSADTGKAKAAKRANVSPTTKRTLVDETILLRYLLRDDESKSARARSIVLSGCACAYPETIAKTVGMLDEEYHVPRSLIGGVIALLASDLYVYDEAAVRLAARLYAESKAPFDTCLLWARNTLTGCPVESFDRTVARKG